MLRYFLPPACVMIASASLALPATPQPKAPGRGTATVPAPVQPDPIVTPPTSRPMRHLRRPNPSTRRIDAANHAALMEPRASGYTNAVQVYPWTEGALYRLFAAPERVSDIALQPGEALVSVAAGDTVRWIVGDTTSGAGADKRTHILIKPASAGLRTNLIIATDRRTYHLQLESTAATAMSAISWIYPADALVALRGAREASVARTPVSSTISVEGLQFGYTISGDDPPWRPLRAFDDGQQTFIEFPASIAVGEAPPLFVRDSAGEAELVNYRVSGRYYVVDRLFDVAELRLGGKRQQIVTLSREGARAGRHAKKRNAS